jgi:hypothetical protein
MNEKNRGIFVIICFCILTALLSGAAFFSIGKNTGNPTGADGYTDRERELYQSIGEYQRREEDRTAREAERLRAEGSRLERTENALGALGGLDRRTGGLLEELGAQVGILEDYFNSSRNDYYRRINNDTDTGEVE